MSIDVTKQTSYPLLTAKPWVATKQTAYPLLRAKDMVFTKQSAYVLLLPPAPPKFGRRRMPLIIN